MWRLFVDLWEANMKTYKELINKDYKYLDGLRYNIAKNANKEND